ncbi:MAG: polysaccharide pyruvyl transferase family protein [Campylobacterota bacterium]
MHNSEYNLYKADDIVYKDLTSNLFYYQKHKDNPWVKGENFGDYLSKIIVGKIAKENGFENMVNRSNKLLAIGSILHFAKSDDIIWGSGINGKISLEKLTFNNLDIRALRGPLTKNILNKMGIKTPDIFGDPALLMPSLFDNLVYKPVKNKVTIIPNLNEYEECKRLISSSFSLISPLRHWSFIIDEILTSEIIYTSSLHGLIISEALNVPVKLFKPFGGETMFKYEDYLEGTGRKLVKMPKTFHDGVVERNGVSFNKLNMELSDLVDSFPYDLFGRSRDD